MSEQWKPVLGWEHRYEVSDMGRIRSFDMRCGTRGDGEALRHGRMLVQVPKQERYLAVTFADGDRREQRLVHFVVLEAFAGPRPQGLMVRHLDGDNGNNALSNLCWGTAQENAEDRITHGNSGKGEAHPGARLREKDVLRIRRSMCSNADLALFYKVTPEHIGAIRARKCWKHI